MRKFIAIAAVACVTACQFGCDPKFPKGFGKVAALYVYTHDKTACPAAVAFIVGSAAPSGGPSGLHALATDQIMPAALASEDPEEAGFPLMLKPLPPHLADKFAVR